MRRIVLIVACLLGLAAGSLGGAAAVFASGTNTSAGNQQYVDPLTGTSSQTTPSSSSSSSSSGSNGSGSTDNSSLAQAPSSLSSSSGSNSSGSTSGSSAGAHGTLPFTGMNLSACIAIAFGLLGTGLVLRRAVRPQH